MAFPTHRAQSLKRRRLRKLGENRLSTSRHHETDRSHERANNPWALDVLVQLKKGRKFMIRRRDQTKHYRVSIFMDELRPKFLLQKAYASDSTTFEDPRLTINPGIQAFVFYNS